MNKCGVSSRLVVVVVVQGELCGTETAAANTMIGLDPSSVEKRVQCTRLCFRIHRYWTYMATEKIRNSTWKKKNLLKRLKIRNWRLLDKRKDVLYKTSPECSWSTLKVRGNYLRFSCAMNDWDKEKNWKLKKIGCLNHRASRANVFFCCCWFSIIIYYLQTISLMLCEGAAYAIWKVLNHNFSKVMTRLPVIAPIAKFFNESSLEILI